MAGLASSIKELQSGTKMVNLLAVVTAFRPPAKTRGKDMSCYMELVDDSEKTIKCVLFGSESSLPRVCPDGSLVCLKRFEVVEYHGRPQLLSHAKLCYWAILSARSNGSIFVSSSNDALLSLNEADKQRARTLKVWVDSTNLVTDVATSAPSGACSAVTSTVHTNTSSNGSLSTSTVPLPSTSLPSTSTSLQTSLPVGGRVCQPKSTRHYGVELTKIGQLAAGMRNVGVCGVVKSFKPPTPSRGRDCYIVVHVVDETSPNNGLTCVIFNPSKEKLAMMGCVGAVVLIKGVRTETNFDTETLQALGHEHTLVGVFTSEVSDVIPAQLGTWYILKDHEKDRVRELRLWSEREGPLLLSTKLANMSIGQTFNVVCLVVAMAVLEEQKLAVLSVLDGTTLKISLRELDPVKSKKKWEFDSDPELFYIYRYFTRDVYVSNINELDVSAGDVVYMKNMQCYQPTTTAESASTSTPPSPPSPPVELRIVGNQGTVVPLDDDSEAAVKIKDGLPIVHGALPVWRLQEEANDIDTLVDDSTPLATLEEIKEASVGSEHLVDVKVLRVSPGSMDTVCIPYCPLCSGKVDLGVKGEGGDIHSCQNDGATMDYKLTFSLLLADDSGELNVLVGSQESQHLLSSILDGNFSANRQTKDKILDVFYALTGGNDPFFPLPLDPRYSYARPMFRCAIKKLFNPSTTADSGQSCNYYLVSTVIHY